MEQPYKILLQNSLTTCDAFPIQHIFQFFVGGKNFPTLLLRMLLMPLSPAAIASNYTPPRLKIHS